MPGKFAARKLKTDRQNARWLSWHYKRKDLKIRASHDPMGLAPQARGIVLQKVALEAKQPNSGLRKCVRVQLIKNGKQITAFAPKDKAITFIDEHDEVIVEKQRASQRGTVGDMPGVRWRVLKVNGIPIKELRKGKKEKPGR